jgi:hypothetical protein
VPILEEGLKRLIGITTAVLIAATAQPLAAQDARVQRPRVPEAYVPPSGMCRLWIDGVPASQQPAPTDCASAIRNRPSNAAVVFGPQRPGGTMELRTFTGRAGLPHARLLTPGAPATRPHDEVRDRGADTLSKPAPRKPEKPQ